jgi:hypothetical protein
VNPSGGIPSLLNLSRCRCVCIRETFISLSHSCSTVLFQLSEGRCSSFAVKTTFSGANTNCWLLLYEATRVRALAMRSSVACSWCRRSKVKCLNDGLDTVCRGCDMARRKCTYSTPVLHSRAGTERPARLNKSRMPRPSSPREKMRASESIEDNGLFADITLKDHSEILDATLLHPGVWSKLVS